MKRKVWLVPFLFLLLLTLSQKQLQAGSDSRVFLPLVGTGGPRLGPIEGPLLVDGEQGRLYTQAEVDGVVQTAVLAAADGRLLASFSPAGSLALDRSRQQLLVDQGDAGLLLLDAHSGALQAELSLPGEAVAAPQIDPDRQRAFVFRNNEIYLVNLETLSIIDTITVSLPVTVCDEQQGPAPIARSYYDLLADLLFVSASTYYCTPYEQETVVVYNSSLQTVAQFELPARYQAVPFAGNLYGSSVLDGYESLGLSYWALDASERWYNQTIPGSAADLKGIVVDWQRSLLYEAVWEYPDQGNPVKMIRVSSTEQRLLQHVVSWEQLALGDARLAGHDPHTDQLYFLEEGDLRILPTQAVLAGDL